MKNILYIVVIALIYVIPINAQQASNNKQTPSDEQLLIIAKQYKYGIIREVDSQKAIKILSNLAKKNNPEALEELGRCYLNGDGVVKNTKLAYKLFKKAEECGSIRAKCDIALIYQTGACGILNYKKAYSLYMEAANSGSVQGMYGVGYLLYKGLGVEQNYSKAIKILEKGAEKGHSGCNMLLASYYANGYDIEQDLDKANHYWRNASRNGNSWTVDVTKNELVDSINNRRSRKGKWHHVKNKVLSDENKPDLSPTIEAKNISGLWSGKAYSYDWSKKNIVNEENVSIDIQDLGDRVHVNYYINDSLETSYCAVLKNGKYISNISSKEQKDFSWTITQTIFNIKGNNLYVDLKALNFKNMSFQKPLLAILEKKSHTDNNRNAKFYINKGIIKNGNLMIKVIASDNINANILLSTINGRVLLTSKNVKINKGENVFSIPVTWNRNEKIVNVSIIDKEERHSRLITVSSNE